MARLSAQAAWIASPRYDLAAFFLPALLGLSAFAAVALGGASPLWLLWLWIALFDGPHMLAAYSRAYGDPASWQLHRRALTRSWGAFLVGPAFLLLGSGLHADWPFSVFLLLMTLYSYHHVVRQHWGFVALYAARSSSSAPRAWRRALVLACWCPYAAFLLVHPSLREYAGLGLAPGAQLAASGLAWALFVVWAGVLLGSLRWVQRALRAGQPVQSPAYLALATAFHGLLYFGLARAEPLFSSAQNLDQTFMMLTVVSGVFHSAQYVSLVVLFHARSSAAPEELAPTWFGRSWGRAASVLLPFLALYLCVACATGVYPGCPAWLARPTPAGAALSQWALALWWGLALHHYWLDERIWHVRSDARLRRIFELAQ